MRKFFCCVLAVAALFVLVTAASVVKLRTDQTAYANQGGVSQGQNFERAAGNLPVLSVDTGGGRIAKESEIEATLSVIDGYETNAIDQEAIFTTDMTIKYRGSSSYSGFDKRSYRIKLYRDSGKSLEYALLGMGEHSEWVLYGPFLDRSLVRNRLLYGLAREMAVWSPDTRYCELYVDGAYQGVYLAVEPVTNGPSRLNLNEFGLITGETAYLLKRDRPGTEDQVIESYGTIAGKTDNELSVAYPASSKLTTAQKRWIEKDLSAFERVLYSENYTDEQAGYAAYIDVDSFVDYYLINELAMISDATHLSTYVYKDIGGKLKMAVWDFNNAFNNYQGTNYDTDEFFLTKGNWYDQLLKDQAFVDKVVARYRQLRRDEWSDERLLGLIDQNIEDLGDAVDRNFELWGYTFEDNLLSRDEEGKSRDPHSFEEAVAMLKDCLMERVAFLDAHIDALYDISTQEQE